MHRHRRLGRAGAQDCSRTGRGELRHGLGAAGAGHPPPLELALFSPRCTGTTCLSRACNPDLGWDAWSHRTCSVHRAHWRALVTLGCAQAELVLRGDTPSRAMPHFACQPRKPAAASVVVLDIHSLLLQAFGLNAGQNRTCGRCGSCCSLAGRRCLELGLCFCSCTLRRLGYRQLKPLRPAPQTLSARKSMLTSSHTYGRRGTLI